ncbi:hypothetical protein JCM10207_006322 [Rhodosporidiobolus poonsookiae]
MADDAAKAPRLPEELIERILSHLAPLPSLDDAAFVKARQELVQIAQCSKQLLRLAQPHMYHHTRFNKHLVDEPVFLDPMRAALVRTARLDYGDNARSWYRDVETLARAPSLEEVEVTAPPIGFELHDLAVNVPALKFLALHRYDQLLPPSTTLTHLVSLTLQSVDILHPAASYFLQPSFLPSLAVLTLGYCSNDAGQQILPLPSAALLDQLDCLVLLQTACLADLTRFEPPVHTATPILMTIEVENHFPILPFPPGSTAPVHLHCFASLPSVYPQHTARAAAILTDVASQLADRSASPPAGVWLHPIFHPSHALHERVVEDNPYLSEGLEEVLEAAEERGVRVEYYTREEEGRSLETARPPAAFWRYARELKRARAGL